MKCHLLQQQCGALCENRSLSAPCSQLKGQTWRGNKGGGNTQGRLTPVKVRNCAAQPYNYMGKELVTIKAEMF